MASLYYLKYIAVNTNVQDMRRKKKVTRTPGEKNLQAVNGNVSERSQLLDLGDEDFKTATIKELNRTTFDELKDTVMRLMQWI